jgi:hypothetical protein
MCRNMKNGNHEIVDAVSEPTKNGALTKLASRSE